MWGFDGNQIGVVGEVLEIEKSLHIVVIFVKIFH